MNATVNQSRLLRRGRIFDFTLENVTLETGVTVDMEIIRHPGAAAIVPLTDDRQVMMLKQYRHAAGQSLWEIPAGTLEKNETTSECARRELVEETGYDALQWDNIGSVIPVPGYSDESIDLFLARQLEPARQQLDADEIIEVHPVPLQTVIEMIDRGDINDAKTVVAIFRTIRQLGLCSVLGSSSAE